MWDVYNFDPVDQPSRGTGSEEDKRALPAWGAALLASITYDSQNRIQSITPTPGGGGRSSLFVWDDWDLIEERDLSGTLLRRYVHGAAIDEVVMSVDANGARYHHHDALGSVTALTDETGTVVESYTYDVFGQPTVFDAAGIPQPAFQAPPSGNRFLFTGREFITEAGVYDYRNRHYSPQLGRFLQTDPIRFDAGDVNLYRYVGNSVLVGFDPDGLLDINNFRLGDPANAGYMNSRPGEFTYGGHGTPKTITGYQGEKFTGNQVADQIKNHPRFKGGNPPISYCTLYSCSTGADPGDGTDPIAQVIADILQIPVWAPEDLCWIQNGKTPYSAPPKDPKNPYAGPDLSKQKPLKEFKPRPNTK